MAVSSFELVAPVLLEKPDSGTADFTFLFYIRDEHQALLSASGPTYAAVQNPSGVDRSGPLSSISGSTSPYMFTYTVSNTTIEEALLFTVTTTAGGYTWEKSLYVLVGTPLTAADLKAQIADLNYRLEMA